MRCRREQPFYAIHRRSRWRAKRRRGGGVGGYEWDRMTLNGAGGLGWAGSGSGWGIGGGMRWLCAKAITQELRKWFYL